ncbi:MAG: efflux RND transporter periplasmic adaptor subunit [Rhodobacteraceae bacterium]|nr:efflux RND transporter periplasmic adaptor subunit [Paracoccaceae bacterium]
MSGHDDADGADEAEQLWFHDDPGARRSAWIAAALLALVAGWFASGMLMREDAPRLPPGDIAPAPVRVAVATSTAERVGNVLILEGQAIPDRETDVIAETSGKIVELGATKGDMLAAEDVIARLDGTGREADLRRAEAELDRASRDYDNALVLLERGVGTLDRVALTRATRAAAEAQLENAREALSDTVIRAPFAGRLEELAINAGEFVSVGAPVARIVDNVPLTVRARVAQQSVARVTAGQAAEVVFITGEARAGRVSFVGTNADPQTRTFLLEVEIANADGGIPSGVSAEIRIETGETMAHFLSPALLALDERGALGLKTVEDGNRVGFYEIAVVRAESDGVWVTGLPEAAQIITIGQGFVRTGETVDPRPDDRALPNGGGGLQ